jgi:hypothetical protein
MNFQSIIDSPTPIEPETIRSLTRLSDKQVEKALAI